MVRSILLTFHHTCFWIRMLLGHKEQLITTQLRWEKMHTMKELKDKMRLREDSLDSLVTDSKMRSFLKYQKAHTWLRTKSRCLFLVDNWFQEWRIRNWIQYEHSWRIPNYLMLLIQTSGYWIKTILRRGLHLVQIQISCDIKKDIRSNRLQLKSHKNTSHLSKQCQCHNQEQEWSHLKAKVNM